MTLRTVEKLNMLLSNRGITVLSRLAGYRGVFLCQKCNHEWETLVGCVVSKNKSTGCPACAGNKFQTDKQIRNRLASTPLVFLGRLPDQSRKGKFMCSGCNHKWVDNISRVIVNEVRCPSCRNR
ncbi:hypothetical protein fHeYen801_128 [Yersinia phage fHe-Yen8-01]|nr:hypothetical protein fHeYen801_128 [Yersinia phage fHe-Yen8-01]